MMDPDKQETPVRPPPPEPKKPVWNSLEVTKLIMSAATPIAVFSMGYVLTQQSQRETQQRANIAAAAERADRQRADKRAAVEKDAERRRGEQLRAAAEADAERLRRDAIARDDALRREARAHELAARAQSVELARYTRKVEKRIELWDKLGPMLSAINEQTIVYGYARARKPDIANSIFVKASEASRVFDAYQPYFSDQFARKFLEYMEQLGGFRYGNFEDTPKALQAMADTYVRLIAMAKRELALAPDTMADATQAPDFAQGSGIDPVLRYRALAPGSESIEATPSPASPRDAGSPRQ